jgi:Caspase domain
MSEPLAVWRRKLEHLQTEEARVSDSAQKFQISEEIREAEERIAQLERSGEDRSPNVVPDPGRATGGVTMSRPDARYAVVIGVSQYEPQPSNRFPDLSFAANDAIEFHRFLQDHNYTTPEPLLNEKATLRAIMHALDDVRRRSKGSTNPVVLIFFSGHGARDADGRHYLVPYDGVRNDLFATALWSETLNSALRLLSTNQLVLVLDACHAAAMENEGVKGDFRPCKPDQLLPEQDGRFVVASCLAHQVSREWDGHGVFSGQLLRLLRFETDEDKDLEELELFDVCQTVKTRVIEETRASQEPWTNVQKETGIVLAVNYARRRARVKQEKDLLDRIETSLTSRAMQIKYGFENEQLLLDELRRCSPAGSADSANVRLWRLYRFFKQTARTFRERPPDDAAFAEFCGRLIEYYKGSDAAPDTRDVLSARSAPAAFVKEKAAASGSETAGVSNAQRPAPAKIDQDAAERPSPAARAVVPTSGVTPERRCLSSDDVSFVLESLRKRANKAKYAGRISRLRGLLSRSDGLSEKEFRTLQGATCTDEDSFWAGVIDEIGTRFEARWPSAFKPGHWTCPSDELIGLSALAGRLKLRDRRVDEWLAGRLSFEAADALAEYEGADVDPVLQQALTHCINTIIHGAAIWDEQRFQDVELRPETARVRTQPLTDHQRLNRMLLEDAYPDALAKKRESLEDPRLAARVRGPNA